LKTAMVLHWLVLGLLLMFASGCDLIAPTPAPPAEPIVATRETDTAAATPTATPLPATPTLAPSPTANPCPELRDIEPPDRDQALDVYMDALRNYLNEGGDPARAVLQEQEGLQQGDLTGDGVPEYVFLLIDPDVQQHPPKGHLAIYSCESGAVTRLYHYEAGDWFGLELIGIEDLTNDAVADLSFSQVSCGASTCWHTPYVWSWQGRDFESRMGTEFIFPYPWYTLQDGALVVVSHGMGSVGAGPQRTITTTLAWSGAVITITGETVAPPAYRYHALVDGDRALAAGDFAAAEAAYQRVVEDASLELWGAFSSTEEEEIWLVAFGRWRLMTLQAYLDHPDEVEALYQTLQAENASGTTASAVAGLAERFWRVYQRSGNVANACSSVVGGTEIPAVLDFLMTFGYANPAYEASHICPFTAAGVGELPF
jgi:hypothetical protein